MATVLGIGLHKTGTTMPGTCFKAPGYDHLSCRKDLLAKLSKGNLNPMCAEIDKFPSCEHWFFPQM